MSIGHLIQLPLFWSDFNKTWIFSTELWKKYSNIKCHENPRSWSRIVPCVRTDTGDMMKLIVAFSDFQNAPKIRPSYFFLISTCNRSSDIFSGGPPPSWTYTVVQTSLDFRSSTVLLLVSLDFCSKLNACFTESNSCMDVPSFLWIPYWHLPAPSMHLTGFATMTLFVQSVTFRPYHTPWL